MFRLSTVVFEVLWEALRLPPMPARLTVDQHGATLAERDRFRTAALAEAERLGLGRPPAIDPRLAGLFDVLAHHDRAVSLRELAGLRRRAYVAARGRRGVRAVVHHDEVTLTSASGDHPVSELITVLPPAPAGPGRAVTLPSSTFDAAMAAYADATDGARARAVLSGAGVSGKDSQRLLAIARDTTGSGSIGVHRHGALAGSLAYADTNQGRYAIVRRADHAGRPHTSLIPADADWLRRHLHQLASPGASGTPGHPGPQRGRQPE